jgi:hypothetical protein
MREDGIGPRILEFNKLKVISPEQPHPLLPSCTGKLEGSEILSSQTVLRMGAENQLFFCGVCHALCVADEHTSIHAWWLRLGGACQEGVGLATSEHARGSYKKAMPCLLTSCASVGSVANGWNSKWLFGGQATNA